MCNLSTDSNKSYALVRMTNNIWFWLGISNEITTRAKSLETNHYAPSMIYSCICPLGSCNHLKSSVNLLVNDSICIGH